jgi:nucleotide-binding universal stress UspA family protein
MDAVIPIPTRVEIMFHKKAEKAIIEKSKDFDLVVLGVTSERVFKEVIFGSVADHVAAKAKCSVLIFHRSDKPKAKMFDKAISEVAK